MHVLGYVTFQYSETVCNDQIKESAHATCSATSTFCKHSKPSPLVFLKQLIVKPNMVPHTCNPSI